MPQHQQIVKAVPLAPTLILLQLQSVPTVGLANTETVLEPLHQQIVKAVPLAPTLIQLQLHLAPTVGLANTEAALEPQQLGIV